MGKRQAPLSAPYLALLAESTRVGLPLRFKTDLIKHDRAILATRDPKAPFLWALNENGTHFCGIEQRPRSGHREVPCSEWATILADIFEGARFYVWDGFALLSFPSVVECRAKLEALLKCDGCGVNPATWVRMVGGAVEKGCCRECGDDRERRANERADNDRMGGEQPF